LCGVEVEVEVEFEENMMRESRILYGRLRVRKRVFVGVG